MQDAAFPTRLKESSQPSSPLWPALVGLLCLPVFTSALLAGPLVSAPALEIITSDGKQIFSDLAIGDDLWVQVRHADSQATVTLSLWDDQGMLITSKQVNTNSSGHTVASLLWFRSGIVGCDDPSDIDMSAHRYPDFDVAEVLLANRDFEIRVEDSLGGLLGTRSMPLVVAAKPRYFYSNLSGCPRSEYAAGESIHLSARDADPWGDTTLYMVDPSDPISPDGLVQEIRPIYAENPQTLDSVSGKGDWTLKMWSGSETVAGSYGAIVSYPCLVSDKGFLIETCLYSVGAFLDDGRSEHGITIQDWSCDGDSCDL